MEWPCKECSQLQLAASPLWSYKKDFYCLIGKWQEFLPRSTLLVIGNFNQVRLMSSCFVTLPLLGERCVTSKTRLRGQGDYEGWGNLPNCHFHVFPQVFHYFSARNSFLLCCVLTTSISVLPGRKKSLYRFLRTTLLWPACFFKQ